MSRPTPTKSDQCRGGYPQFTTVFGGKSEHRCWYALGDRAEMEGREATDIESKAEKRILSALWPSGAYTNKDQMLLSRKETKVAFTCVWCKDVLSINLVRPKPEVVYIPQIRVETVDADRILAMYTKLTQILAMLESNPDSSPQISKDTHPELCKSRDKYFVAPVNMLQSVGFERVDKIYKVPDNTSAVYPQDMRLALEAEIEALKVTHGNCDLSATWLPWEAGALSSRICHYVDNVRVYLDTLYRKFQTSGPNMELFNEAKRAWSWSASYWYFEYYSILRGDYRSRANTLLNIASGLVCHIHKYLSHSTDLSLCFSYRHSEIVPPSLIRVQRFVTAIVQGLWSCSETYRGAVLAVEPETEPANLWFHKVQRVFAHMTFGKYSSYDAKYIFDVCSDFMSASKCTVPAFREGLTPSALIHLLTVSVQSVLDLNIQSCNTLLLDQREKTDSLKRNICTALTQLKSAEELANINDSAVFHICVKQTPTSLEEIGNLDRINLQFEPEMLSEVAEVYSQIRELEDNKPDPVALVESIKTGWNQLQCKGADINLVCDEILRAGERKTQELTDLKERYHQIVDTFSEIVIGKSEKGKQTTSHCLSSIVCLSSDGSAACFSKQPTAPHTWFRTLSDVDSITSHQTLGEFTPSLCGGGGVIHMFYEQCSLDPTTPEKGSQQQHHCWASIVSESESADIQSIP
eukprot:TRINITY_DN12013_c0_g1_i1.p1 TRINITY_DN12013_c0_g1~~TRINITY_DN12013_c0_g1_i1.p1  ORF type:complete len:693 (+),score=68.57 TRINITY_DN12013_c0_g1_i1:76-2154(+)